MKPQNKVKLTERVVAAFTKQDIAPEKIEKLLTAYDIADATDIPIDAPWEVHLDTRLMQAPDHVLVKLAQEHGAEVIDLLDAKMIKSKHCHHFVEGTFNLFRLKCSISKTTFLETDYYIIENPPIPNNWNSRTTYNVLRLHPTASPTPDGSWLEDTFKSSAEAMLALNEDFEIGLKVNNGKTNADFE